MFSVSLSLGDEKLVCLINWIPGSAAAKVLSAFPHSKVIYSLLCIVERDLIQLLIFFQSEIQLSSKGFSHRR